MRRNRFKGRRKKKAGRLMDYLRRAVMITISILGMFVMSLILVSAHDFLTRSELFRAATIQVNGLSRLSVNEVLRMSRLQKGDNILAVNLSLTRKRLLAHPWIADVSVRRRLPDTLELSVIEQVPLAVVDLGRKFVINQNGEIFKKADASDENRFPIISGLSFTDLNYETIVGGHIFGSVLAVLRLGDEPDSVIPNCFLKSVHVDREVGLTLVAFQKPLVIRLGYRDYPAKFDILNRLLTHFDHQITSDSIEWIDLKDPRRVVLNRKGERARGKEKEV